MHNNYHETSVKAISILLLRIVQMKDNFHTCSATVAKRSMKNFSKILIITLCFGLICVYTLYTVLIHKCKHKTKYNEKLNREDHKDEVLTTFKLSMKKREMLINGFNKRKNKIKYFCGGIKNLNDTILNKAMKNLIVDMKYNLTWCPIYKSASSMWMKNFALLTGFPVTQRIYLMQENHANYNFVVKQKFQNKLNNLNNNVEQIKKTKKFLVVRHPFERLLSAYRDKLEQMQGREYYYKRYGQYITHRYRANQSNLTILEPSFTEFLQFIAKEKQFDEHWVPFFFSCQPCSIDYDYIFKFEHLVEEYNFFIQENNLYKCLNYLGNERKNTNSRGITNDIIAEKYFESIPLVLLKSIYKIYEFDFILFSYSPTKYYNMTVDFINVT